MTSGATWVRTAGLGLGLVLLFVAALWQRSVGLDFLLPHHPEPDAQIVLQAAEFRTGVREIEFVRSTYPHLLGRLLSLLPTQTCSHPTTAEHLDCHLRAAASPYLKGRWLIAVLCALAIPLTYLLARRWLSVPGSLFAALLLCTSLLHVNYSQQARPHGAFATAAALCLLAALHLRARGTWWTYAAFGVAIAAAIGILHTAAFLVLLGPAALMLRANHAERPTLARVALPVALAALSGFLFWPFLFESAPAGPWTEGESYRFPHRVEGSWFNARGFGQNLEFLLGHDPALAALLAAAIALVAWRRKNPLRDPQMLLVLVFALPYALMIGAFQKTYPRFLLPLYPLLCVAAAVPLDALWRSTKGSKRVLATVALAALALSIPAYASGRLLWLRAQPDTLERLADQIWALPLREQLVVAAQPTITLPILVHQDLASRVESRKSQQNQPWLVYVDRKTPDTERAGGPRLQGMQIEGRFPAHLVSSEEGQATLLLWLSKQRGDLYLFSPGPNQKAAAILHSLIAQLGLYGEWHPGPAPTVLSARSHDYQDSHLLARVLERRVWGPAVGVFASPRYMEKGLPPIAPPELAPKARDAR